MSVLNWTNCLLVYSLICLSSVLGADPVLTPATVSNGNNTASSDSTITWGPIPPGKEYTSDAEYDDGGMGPLFDFARSFINTAIPNEFPSGLVTDIIDGKFAITTDYMRIVEDFAGYGACIVIGFLFMIIFTIVGCCFCCCRCCGNCGGKKIQKRSPSTSCRRKVYSVILLVLVIFTSVGAICVFVSNDRMTTSLKRYGPTVSTNMDDMISFVDNTVAQVNHVLKNDVNFAFDVVQRDLDNIDVLVGIPVRENLDTTIQATPLFDQIGSLQTDVSQAITEFDVVDTDLTDFKTHFTTFKTESDLWITDYNSDKTTCGTPCDGFPDGNALTTTIDPDQININSSRDEINKIRSQDMGALVSTARDQFNNIPERVKNESLAPLQDISNAITNYKNEIKPLTDSINDVKNSVNNGINLENLKKDITFYSDTAQPFDQYRWYGGIGLAAIITLIVVLQFFGLAFGVCGGSGDTVPTERGCLSNSGGNMLMAAVGFIFIFTWLLTFLTMLCFMLGAPMERYFCQSLADPELKAINQILTDVVKLKPSSGSGSWLGETILGDPQVDLTFQGILGDCKDGKTAYEAFSLKNLNGFNLTTITNYKDSIDIETQINAINVDWNQIEIAPQSLKDNLDDFKASVTNMDFSTYIAELDKNPTGTDLQTFLDDFQAGISSLSAGPEKTALEARYTDLVAIRDGNYTNTLAAKNKLSTSMNTLSTTFSGLPVKIDGLKTKLNAVETVLQTNGSAVLQDVLTTYTNRIFSVVDSLINRAVNGLKEDIAKCTPIYNLYQSVIVIGLCKYMLDAFNGFWFSLGWCIFFFVPSTIFAVKLAKHYSRMKFLDEYDSTLPSKHNDVIRDGSPPPAYNFGDGNKVGHSDKF